MSKNKKNADRRANVALSVQSELMSQVFEPMQEMTDVQDEEIIEPIIEPTPEPEAAPVVNPTPDPVVDPIIDPIPAADEAKSAPKPLKKNQTYLIRKAIWLGKSKPVILRALALMAQKNASWAKARLGLYEHAYGAMGVNDPYLIEVANELSR